MKAFTKILCLLLAMMMVLSLAACSEDDDDGETGGKQKETVADKDTDKDTDKDEDKDTDKDEDKDTDKDEDKDTDKDEDKDTDKEETIVGTWEGTLSEDAISAMLGVDGLDIDTELMLYFEFDKNGEGKLGYDEDNFKDFMEEAMELSLEMQAEEMGMTVDDVLELMGMTMKEYIELVLEELDGQELGTAFTYEIDGDKLTLINEDDEESVITFELDGDELEMKDCEEDDAGDFVEGMFPMTLKRVK